MLISFFPACHNLGVAPSFEPLGLSFPADLSAGEGSQGKETGHSSGAQVSPRFLFHPTQLRGTWWYFLPLWFYEIFCQCSVGIWWELFFRWVFICMRWVPHTFILPSWSVPRFLGFKFLNFRWSKQWKKEHSQDCFHPNCFLSLLVAIFIIFSSIVYLHANI